MSVPGITISVEMAGIFLALLDRVPLEKVIDGRGARGIANQLEGAIQALQEPQEPQKETPPAKTPRLKEPAQKA
jgi:hypothetical protein